MSSGPEYRPFGAFRLILSIMVLLQHGLLVLRPDQRETMYSVELGAVAVAVFFALSGFIVAEAVHSFYRNRPAAFLINRILRLVPPYLAALVVTVGVDCALYSAGWLQPLDAGLIGAPWEPRVLAAAVLEILPGLPATRLSGQAFSFIPFVWTLRVEAAFYLLTFSVCWLGMLWPAWRRRVVGITFVLSYILFGIFLADGNGSRQFLNVPFFAFGICVFLVRSAPCRFAWLHLGLISACVPLAFVHCGERGHPVLAFQVPVLCGLFACLPVLARWRPAARWRKWDARLGALSYPLYIGHGVILTLLCGLLNFRGGLIYCLAILMSAGLAVILHEIVERPLRRVRDGIRGVRV